MLETEKLDDLFRLLKEMTQSKRSDPRLTPPIAPCLEKYSKIGIALSVIVFLVLVTWRHFLGTTPLPPGFPDVLSYLAVFLLMFVPLFAVVTLIAAQYYRAWFQGKHGVWITLENDLRHDAHSIAQLLRMFNKATLAYGLLQYRYQLSFLESRAALIGGNLRKLGLFPALAALAVSGAVLYKEDSNLFLWGSVILAAIFYPLTLITSLSLERRQQVIQLLEYAIEHADQGNAIPPDANH